MSIKSWVATAGALALMLALFGPTLAQAQCPEGKEGLTFATPSGQIKVLCVSEAAVPGIEKAPPHAEITCAPASCPCFSQFEIDEVAGAGSNFACFRGSGVTSVTGKPCTLIYCVDEGEGSPFFSAAAGPADAEADGYCTYPAFTEPAYPELGAANLCASLRGWSGALGEAEGDACVTILAPLATLDADLDTAGDEEDNCPQVYNPSQEDLDANGIGDACEAAGAAEDIEITFGGDESGPKPPMLHCPSGRIGKMPPPRSANAMAVLTSKFLGHPTLTGCLPVKF